MAGLQGPKYFVIVFCPSGSSGDHRYSTLGSSHTGPLAVSAYTKYAATSRPLQSLFHLENSSAKYPHSLLPQLLQVFAHKSIFRGLPWALYRKHINFYPTMVTPFPLHCYVILQMTYYQLACYMLIYSLIPVSTPKPEQTINSMLSSLLYPQCLESAIHVLNAQIVLAEWINTILLDNVSN